MEQIISLGIVQQLIGMNFSFNFSKTVSSNNEQRVQRSDLYNNSSAYISRISIYQYHIEFTRL